MNNRPAIIPEILSHSASLFSEKTALQTKTQDAYTGLTYSQLQGQSRGICAYLQKHGLKKGGRVGILSESRPEWAVVYFGILLCGGVVVGIDTKLRDREIESILAHSQAEVLFTSSDFAGRVDCAKTICLDDDEYRHAVTDRTEGALPEVIPGDLAMLVYTSGTTGSPKAVMLTHANIVSNVLAAHRAIPAYSSDRFLSVLPLNHLLELTGGLLGPIYSGSTVTYLRDISAAAIQKALKETRTTVMLGVPLMFKIMLSKVLNRIEESIQPVPAIFSFNMRMARASRRLRIGRLLLRRIRREFGGHVKHFICGGAPLEEEVEVAFRCMGMPILQGYGLTEASPVVSVNTKKVPRMGSVGRPLEGVAVRIAGDGEILVTGPNVMTGYYKDPQSTSSVLVEGELHTGDIGRLDTDGFLYITGRKKNIIVTATGKNIHPEEMEATLGVSPFISDICIVGKREGSAESPFAFVIPDYDHFGKLGLEKDDATVREVIRKEIQRLSRQLPDYERVSNLAIYKGEFPKTTTRKVKRTELVEIARDWLPVAERSVKMDDFAEHLKVLVAELCDIPGERISLDSDLSMDLGVDSLLKVEILTAVESELGIIIPDEVSHRISTFRELADLAREYQKERAGEHLTLEQEEEPYEFLKERSALRRFAKRYLAFCFRALSKWYFGLEVMGSDHLSKLGSFIITPNHNSLLDVPIVLSSLPRAVSERVFSPAAQDYFFEHHPFRKWFITLAFDAFPFDRQGNFMKALKKCKRTIEQGKSLILFPEGTRSTTGQLLPFRTGLAALAFDLGIPVVPTYIEGIHTAFGKGKLFPRPGKIRVRFGEPISMDKYQSGRSGRRRYDVYRDIMEDVRKEILKLT
jgi:long-chain acyl-CoA synthetase